MLYLNENKEMKTINKFFIQSSFTLLIAVFVLCIQFEKINAEQVSPDAIFNSIKHEYTLNPDGTIVYKYEHNLKLISYMSFNRLYGESFITYNPDFQELNILKSETKSSTGSITKSPFNAYNKVLPGAVGQAVPYMNLREMVVTHTGLERNAEVDFAYTLKSQKGYYPGLIGKIVIGSHDAVKYFEIVLKVPKDMKINLHMSNNGPMGEKYTRDNFDFYTWKLNNLPLIPIESHQPDMELFMPTLYFSTASIADIAGHIKIDSEKIFQLTEKQIENCKDIVKYQLSFQDKVFALREHVEQNVGQTNIELSEIGWKTLPATETFARNVGSKLDRAILLAAMCKAVGINADIVFVPKYTNAKPDLTLLSQFGEYIVYCTSESSNDMSILLDPNRKQTNLLPVSIANRPSYVLNPKKIYLIPAVEETSNFSFVSNLKFSGKPEILEGESNIQLRGNYIPNMDIAKTNEYLKNLLAKNGWTVEEKGNKTTLGNDFKNNFNIKKKDLTKFDEIIELDLPFISNRSNSIELIPATRVTPFDIGEPVDEEYDITIEIPEGKKSLYNPEEINIENPAGKIKSKITIEKNRIKISRKLQINKRYIAPEEYHHLYKLLSSWKNKYHNKVYLK